MSCSISNSAWSPNGITVAGLENELHSPFAVIFPNNYASMFVADTRNNRILQYDSNFRKFTMVYDGSDTGQNIAGPMAIAMADDESELIVASYSNKRVLRWSFITNSSSLVSFSYLAGPTGVAIDHNKIIFVAASMVDDVFRYGPDASPYWLREDQFVVSAKGAKHITIVNDSIYIAISEQCRVIKVSLIDNNRTKVVVAGNGRIGSTSNRLRFPWGVAVDPIEGHVFISDTGNHRIQLWLVNATEGITIAGITAQPGAQINQLNRPHGLTFGFDRSLFVADTENGRIQKFQRYCIV